jgi:NAD(P)H-flavin reductase
MEEKKMNSQQIEGRNAVMEAFRSGKPIDKVYILDGCQDGPIRSIVREAKKHDTILNFVTKERLNQISETGRHQGVIAQAAAYEYAQVEDMLELAKQLDAEKTVVLGYRTSTFLKEEFEEVCDVKIATEDGSQGAKGTVIDAIEKYGVEGKVIYACGPMPMLKALAAYAEEHGMEAQISLEERMACGIGACLGCICKSKTKDHHTNVNNTRICKDGPVFDAKEVVFS